METKHAIFLGEKLAIDKLTIEECDWYLDIIKKTSEKLELRKVKTMFFVIFLFSCYFLYIFLLFFVYFS